MKAKLFTIVATVLLSAGIANAERMYGMAGCGLGNLALGKDMQVLAATTNGTGVQGFGILSGTSNCLEPGEMAQVEAQQQFVSENLPSLSKEMARGEGEYLQAFSYTMGCADSAYPKFAETMQSSYSDVFKAPGAMAVLKSVRQRIKSDEYLSKNCNTVI